MIYALIYILMQELRPQTQKKGSLFGQRGIFQQLVVFHLRECLSGQGQGIYVRNFPGEVSAFIQGRQKAHIKFRVVGNHRIFPDEIIDIVEDLLHGGGVGYIGVGNPCQLGDPRRNRHEGVDKRLIDAILPAVCISDHGNLYDLVIPGR